MSPPVVAALVAWSLVGCIESQTPRVARDSEVDAGVDGDDAEDAVDAGDDGAEVVDGTGVETEDAEVADGQCRTSLDCPPASGQCREVDCVDERCVERSVDEGSACDDGDPCTGVGRCAQDVCARGAPVEDGVTCDDGLLCNGVSACQGGQCVIAVPPTCPAPSNPCAAEAVCSEEAGGVCVDVPVADGLACVGPTGAVDPERWQCSGGRCVPPDMVFVAGGVFTMGCLDGYCGDDNGPAHEVRLSRYAVDRAEVSEEAWRRCRDDADQRGLRCNPRPNESDPAVSGQADEAPLRWVDWSRAANVCAYAGKRLCTEAEWEYAARGKAAAFYPWGNLPPTCERATFFDGGAPGCGSGSPVAVGSKPAGASPWGALDLAGNVLEWCVDFYRPDIYEVRASVTAVDPVQDEVWEQPLRVVRGGSYRDGVASLRVFVRAARSPDDYTDDVGVRCCLSLPEP